MITYQKALLQVPEIFTAEQIDIAPFNLTAGTEETFSFSVPNDKYIRVTQIINGVYENNTTIFSSVGSVGRLSSVGSPRLVPFWLGPGQSIVCIITVTLTGTTRSTSYVFATRRSGSTDNELIWQSGSSRITANTFVAGPFFSVVYERYPLPENNLPDELVAT